MTALTGKPMPDAEFMLPVRPSASWRVACCPSSETQVSRATAPSVMSSTSMLPNLDSQSDASVSFAYRAAELTADGRQTLEEAVGLSTAARARWPSENVVSQSAVPHLRGTPSERILAAGPEQG